MRRADAQAGAARPGVPAPFLAAVAALLTYAGTLAHGLPYDDAWKLQQLAAGACPGDWLGTRGLTHLLHCAQYGLWGDQPAGYHATSVGLHALASALAAGAAFALARSRAVALVAGLAFAVHPVHVEAVASFANQKDLAAGCFVAVALILWRRRGRPAYVGALAAWGLALWSKEVAAAALPAMLLASDALPLADNPPLARERWRRAGTRIAPLALAAITAAVLLRGPLVAALAPDSVARATERRAASWSEAVATALAHVPEQARLLLAPVELAADHAVVPAAGFADPRTLAGAALLVAVLAAAVALWRRAPVAAFGLLWCPVMLLPASNLVPLTPFFVAERYLYAPSFGICLLAGWLAATGWRRWRRRGRRAVLATAGGLVLALAVLRSAAGAAAWRDDGTLWRANLEAGETTFRAHLGLANHLRAAGRRAAAVEHLRAALELEPLTSRQRWTVVRNLARAGAVGAAAEGCREILRAVPDDFDCHFITAEAARARGDRAAALHHYRRAVRARPGDVEVVTRTARLLAELPPPLGDPAAAVELAERARRRSPHPDPALLEVLAIAHAAAGDPVAASLWRHRAIAAARSEDPGRVGGAGLDER